jgi:hypothetical protein
MAKSKRSKEQLLKIYQMIEDRAKEKFVEGKGGRPSIRKKRVPNTFDFLKRKVDEAFQMSRKEQNSKIVKEVIGFPVDLWIDVIKFDGDQKLWLRATEREKDNKFLYSQEVIACIRFVVNDVCLEDFITKLGDSLKYVKHLTIRNRIKTYEQSIEIYVMMERTFGKLNGMKPEHLGLERTPYICRYISPTFAENLKTIDIIGYFTVDEIDGLDLIDKHETFEDEEAEEEWKSFYSNTGFKTDFFHKRKKIEIKIENVNISYAYIPISDQESSGLEKATFVKCYPGANLPFTKKLIIKDCMQMGKFDNRPKVLFEQCYVYKCHIFLKRSRNGARDCFLVPNVKDIYLDQCEIDYDDISYSSNDFAFGLQPTQLSTEKLYVNKCKFKHLEPTQELTDNLKMVSFDDKTALDNPKTIKYFKEKMIDVKSHTNDDFERLVEKTFK